MRRSYVGAVGVIVLAAGCGGGSGGYPPHGTFGANVDISHATGLQAEVAVAADPGHPGVLVAGSNSGVGENGALPIRTYTSVDGGRGWRSLDGPTIGEGGCESDPGVAIDRDGREYLSFVLIRPCTEDGIGRLYVSTRAGPAGPWGRPVQVSGLGGDRLQDRPALTVDTGMSSPRRGRIWIVWRQFGAAARPAPMLESHSDDHGRHWTPPVVLGRQIFEASLATGADGSLDVAATNSLDRTIDLIRVRPNGSLSEPVSYGIGVTGPVVWDCRHVPRLAAMPDRCVLAGPSIGVDPRRGRAYVAWSGPGRNGSRDVFVRVLDRWLVGLGAPLTLPPPVIPDDGPRSDQFLPALAVDRSTGDVWVCFYDTRGDPRRRRARWSCAVSLDSGRSWRRVAAASVASDESGDLADRFGYGDYEGVVAADGVAHTVWTDSRKLAIGGEEIYGASLAAPTR